MGYTQILTTTTVDTPATTLSKSWSTAPVSGNFLGIVVSSGAVVNTPAGWNVGTSGVANNGAYFFWKKAGSSEPGTVTVTNTSSANASMIIFERDDIVSTSPIDVVATPASRTTNTTAALSTTLTPGSASTLVLGMIASTTDYPGWSQWQDLPVGFNKDAEISTTVTSVVNLGVMLASAFVPASGTVTAFSATPYRGDGVTLQPSAGFALEISIKTTGLAPLTVNVGADQSIYTANTLTLSASAVGGSGTRSYAWTQTSGPTSATFGSPTSATTLFTPSGGAGSYVLRCTVTDGSGSAFDELTVTVSPPPSIVRYMTITSSSGWTASSGTILSAVSDGASATFITSANNPTNQVLQGGLQDFGAAPTGNVTVRLNDWTVSNASSYTVTADLIEGATTRATATGTSANVSGGALLLTWNSSSLASVTSWSSLILKLTVTAS